MSATLLPSCWCRRRNLVILGVLALLACTVIVKRYVYENNGSYYYEETQLSHALQKIVEFGTNLHSLELRIRKILQEDPYATLVETKVKPAHEKMQSIKKQTKIYENMQRIPGGPQNFMSTALTAVEETRRKILTFEEEYYRISTDVTRQLAALDRETQTSWSEAASFLTENDLRVLLLKGIFLDKPKKSTRKQQSAQDLIESDDVHSFPKHEKRSFEEMLDSLSSLSELALKVEKVKTEFESLIIKYNITEPEEVLDTPAYPLAKELSKLDKELETRIRNENYQACIPYVRKYLVKLDNNLKDVQAHLSKKRLRYESLVEMLETDQVNLKDRIKKLRFSKNKDEF